ncbi:MAG: HipA domain-containing protein, partial [Clostridiales bacterium]|nr:HipA domain-containing protein [Clostridiales bacterium]
LGFNYIYANGDAHMKNFSIQILNNECILAPAYDLMNTSLHLDGDDLGLQGGLFRSGWRSEVYERTGHPCRTDYEEFGRIIGIPASRIKRIITQFQTIPQEAISLISRSFLDDKSKRSYLRIISERTARFCRQSEI